MAAAGMSSLGLSEDRLLDFLILQIPKWAAAAP
jgi:hypothetical protein